MGSLTVLLKSLRETMGSKCRDARPLSWRVTCGSESGPSKLEDFLGTYLLTMAYKWRQLLFACCVDLGSSKLDILTGGLSTERAGQAINLPDLRERTVFVFTCFNIYSLGVYFTMGFLWLEWMTWGSPQTETQKSWLCRTGSFHFCFFWAGVSACCWAIAESI